MEVLAPPDGAVDDPDAVEVARIWVTHEDLLVSLRVGMYSDPSGPGDAIVWGDILADTIKHLANAIALAQGTAALQAQEEILGRCTESLQGYWKEYGGTVKP
jgi:Domain of unknown function (DUF5076)